MANINIKKALERISKDLEKTAHHAHLYSGVSAKDAEYIDNMATAIAVQATHLSAMARESQGDRSAKSLVTKVRKALGFTYP